jgi:hypothetical protein
MAGPGQGRVEQDYVEPGGSWRPFWLVAAALAVFVGLDVVLPGGDVPPVLWVVGIVAVLGVVGAGTLSAQRVWTVRVDESALTVGREAIALRDVDGDHLREVDAGVDAGAPVLGGGWSLPRGRTGLPLRLADGRTLLVPTRDPAALSTALLAALPGAPDDRSGSQGTLDP